MAAVARLSVVRSRRRPRAVHVDRFAELYNHSLTVASPFICRESSISGDVVYQVLDSENGRGRRMARPRHAASRPCRGLPLVAHHHRTIAMHAPTCLTLFHGFPLMRTPLLDLGGTGFL